MFSPPKCTATVAACLIFTGVAAIADDQTAAEIALLKQIASQGQDQKTADQVNKYIDQNQAAIAGLLRMYQKQIQAATDPNGAPVGTASTDANPDTSSAPDTASNTQPASNPPPQLQSPQPQSAPAAHSALQPSTSLQPSGDLQITGIQPSTGLRTSHLAGYPSLPAVDPTDSVTQMSAEQSAYALKVEKENAARKASLMTKPQGYDY